MCNKTKIIVVVGPTASGKTSLSIELAKSLNGEIVSCDSMQIYKDMNIATAKPTVQEMENIPHHLIDFVPIDCEYDLSQYVKKAKETIADIVSRGKVAILVGGTGLYVNNLIDNIELVKTEVNKELREELNQNIKTLGGEKMLEELSKFDPETAKILHPNDHTRIVRAIEIYKTTNITMSQQKVLSRQHESNYNPLIIGLNYQDREVLYSRIDKRVDIMVENGLLEETKKILACNLSKTASQAIGYKELKPYFNGELSLEICIENLKRESRRYAKRQLSWFRRDPRINWLYPDSQTMDSVIQSAVEMAKTFLNG